MKIFHNIHGWINNETPTEGEVYLVAHGGKMVNGELVGYGSHTDIYTATPATPNNGTKITKLAYSLRIGADEIDIESVAETDPEVRVLIKRVDRSPYIDLANPVVIAGLDLLVSKVSLPNFTEARKNEILNTPVTASEAYTGDN